MPFRKVGVSGGSLVANIVPVVFEAFQFVGIGDVAGILHIQGGKLDAESILIVRQGQEVRIIDVSGQYATFFGSHRLLGLLQAGEDDGRNVCTCMDGIRKEV